MTVQKSVMIARLTGSPYRLVVSGTGERFVLQEERERRWRMVTWANDGFGLHMQIYRRVPDPEHVYWLQHLIGRFSDYPRDAVKQVRMNGPISARTRAVPVVDVVQPRRGRRR